MELTAFVNHAFGKIFNMIHRIFWVRFLRDTTRNFINAIFNFTRYTSSLLSDLPAEEVLPADSAGNLNS